VGDKNFHWESAMEPQPLLFSTDPAHGHWQYWTRQLPAVPNAATYGYAYQMKPGMLPTGPWDPGLFADNDGRTYLYWGSSNVFPLYGAQIDLGLSAEAEGEGKRVSFVTMPAAMVKLDPESHGWERFGQDHVGTIKPFLEGAWMNRVGHLYYLQYAAPGTEFNGYATGVYIGAAPLGPFVYAGYNPVGYKPGGYVNGAGHGSTFADAYGNYWNTGTMWIGLNWPFERRLDMFPAGFRDDGQMWIDTRFGDFPHRVPDHALADGESTFTGWMLLSYRKKATAPALVDENPRTYWLADRNAPGVTASVDLGGVRTVHAIQVNYADVKSGRYGTADDIVTQFRLEGSSDGKTWQQLADWSRESRDHANAYVELANPVRIRHVRYVHVHVGAKTLALADIRVFGRADGAPPATPAIVAAKRSTDPRDALITWKPVKGAVGYNVRWGIAPDRLDLTYQRWADQPTTLELRALSRGVGYFVGIEAFDEHGVSGLSQVLPF
jgi:xylan 1,4-beta-xylosidase